MSAPPVARLSLIGGFRLSDADGPIAVRPSGERLLAFLALKPPTRREAVAWRLWMDRAEDHALGSLRSTLWRLPKPGGASLVEMQGAHLTLSPRVATDIDLTDGRPGPEPPPDRAALGALFRSLSLDLLPGWYDDWLVGERERHRQRRLHALEDLADRLIDGLRLVEAIEVGLCAVDAEPLRESAHRCVVRAHLAEGNVGEALRQVAEYRRALVDAGISARLSAELEALLAPHGGAVPRGATGAAVVGVEA